MNDTHPVLFGLGLTLNIEGTNQLSFSFLGESGKCCVNYKYVHISCIWDDLTSCSPQWLLTKDSLVSLCCS